MHKLSGLDEMFLSVDTGTTTGIMGGLVIYDRPAGSDAGSAAAMVERVTERLDHLPPLRWQLTKVPFGIDHAYWREAETVDVPALLVVLTADRVWAEARLRWSGWSLFPRLSTREV